MGDAFRKVQPGQRLQIPAKAYNAMLDAAKAHQATQQHIKPGNAPNSQSEAGIVRVKNGSSTDCPQQGILGIDGPRWTDDAAIKRQLVLGCDLPQHPEHSNGCFVVATEPIAAGKVGRAMIDGLVLCRVQIDDVTHDFADLETPGNVARLVSTPLGAAHIVWPRPATATGEQWALVRLGRRVPFSGSDAMVKQLESIGGVQQETYDYPRMHGAS